MVVNSKLNLLLLLVTEWPVVISADAAAVLLQQQRCSSGARHSIRVMGSTVCRGL